MTRVGFQGETGAFSEQAALTLFPDGQALAYHGLPGIFADVMSGTLDYGVVPMENSSAGSINETYDLLGRGGVHIVGEVVLSIQHALLALPGTDMAQIRLVRSHPQALAQCQQFLAALGVQLLAVYDTAGAAKQIVNDNRIGEAAVASQAVAPIYGLTVLRHSIQDDPDNQTRFAAISTSPTPLGPANKTSIVFEVSNTPGSLYRGLGPLASRNLNMSKLESRPSGAKPWHPRFYLDIDAGIDDDRLRDALTEFALQVSGLRVLGSYQRFEQ